MRFIHIADVHLGMGFESASFGPRFGKEKREGVWNNLKGIVKICQSESIDLLLIAGDFMEADFMKAGWAMDLAYLFKSIPTTQIVITHGNHDPLSRLDTFYKPLSSLPHVTICQDEYETIYIESLQTSIYTHGWIERKAITMEWHKLMEQIEGDTHHPKYKIAMLHGDMYNEGPYLYLDVEYMKGLSVDYIALGHIHKPDIVANKIAYPGSLEPLDFSEQGTHGYILGHFDKNHLSLSHQSHMEWPFYECQVDLTDTESVLEVIEKVTICLRGALADNPIPMSRYMVRCHLKGFRSPYMSYDWMGAKQACIEKLEDVVAYMEIVDETQLDVDMEQLEREHRDDLIGLFIEQVKHGEEDVKLREDILRTGVSLLLNHERGGK